MKAIAFDLGKDYECDVCRKAVGLEVAENGEPFPASRYWNGQTGAVYCGPECSVEGHAK